MSDPPLDFSSATNYVVGKARLMVIHLSAADCVMASFLDGRREHGRGSGSEWNSVGVVLLSADTSDTDTDTDI